MQPSLPSYSLFNSLWLSESGWLMGDLIKEMASMKKEGEKHCFPLTPSNIVLRCVCGISETQQAYVYDSWALEIPTKFRLCFESLWKQRLSVCYRSTSHFKVTLGTDFPPLTGSSPGKPPHCWMGLTCHGQNDQAPDFAGRTVGLFCDLQCWVTTDESLDVIWQLWHSHYFVKCFKAT